MKHICEWCPLRAKYDKKPKSLAGRFWRWHINYCHGWRKFYDKLDSAKQDEICQKYDYKRFKTQK